MSEIVLRENKKIGEKYCVFRHKSGLTVLFSPNSYSGSFAILSSKFGSADTEFSYGGKTYKVPQGTAHFLEHKLFETEDGGDAFDLFAKYGASANAYTSSSVTSYLFSSLSDFYVSLEILLDFVIHPHFTEDSVERERKIIEEELLSYEESPSNRCFFELMRCLYKSHPVREDIGGTAASVAEITPDTLYLCHKAFYDPENIILVIAGNLDIEKIGDIIDKKVPAISGGVAEKIYPKEPDRAVKKLSRTKMFSSMPFFAFGVKDAVSDLSDTERNKRALAISILADMYFGQSSEFFTSLYEEGLVTGDFSAEYAYSSSYGHLTITGAGRKPFTVKKRIEKYVKKIKESGINAEDLELSKKIFYSGFIGSLQSSASYAYELLYCYLEGHDPLNYPDELKSITPEYAYGVFKSFFDEKRFAFSVIEPF